MKKIFKLNFVFLKVILLFLLTYISSVFFDFDSIINRIINEYARGYHKMFIGGKIVDYNKNDFMNVDYSIQTLFIGIFVAFNVFVFMYTIMIKESYLIIETGKKKTFFSVLVYTRIILIFIQLLLFIYNFILIEFDKQFFYLKYLIFSIYLVTCILYFISIYREFKYSYSNVIYRYLNFISFFIYNSLLVDSLKYP